MPAKRRRGRSPRAERGVAPRYTVDASVFVNAFNPREAGHGASFAFLSAIRDRGNPVIVPALVVPEVAAAVARAAGDATGALQYATAIAALPHFTLVSLTPEVARQAADLAAAYRLRGADAVYVAIARRYGTTIVSRDVEQKTRGAAAIACQTPEEALDLSLEPSARTRVYHSE